MPNYATNKSCYISEFIFVKTNFGIISDWRIIILLVKLDRPRISVNEYVISPIDFS